MKSSIFSSSKRNDSVFSSSSFTPIDSEHQPKNDKSEDYEAADCVVFTDKRNRNTKPHKSAGRSTEAEMLKIMTERLQINPNDKGALKWLQENGYEEV